MLARLFKRNTSSILRTSSIIIQPTSVTIAVVDGDSISVQQIPCPNKDYVEVIRQFHQETSLADSYCQVVLGHGLYQIAQIEKPAIPENEYAKALLWSAKDLVNIPSENLILDYFEYVSNNTNTNKINVIACDKTMIKPIVDLLSELQVSLKGISIIDIVLSQLASTSAANVLVFHLPGLNILLAVIKDGQLCFSRHIKGYDNLHQMSEVDFQAGALNNLGLEIQRCIDFSIGQLKLNTVANVMVLVQSFDAKLIAESLQEFFDVNVQLLETGFAPEFSRFPLGALALSEMELSS